MKIRTGFVSNSSSSSFIVTHFTEYSDELIIYEFSRGNEDGSDYNMEDQEWKLWEAVALELGREDIYQNEHLTITTKDVPITWSDENIHPLFEKYGRLMVKAPIRFLDIKIVLQYAGKYTDEILEVIKDEN